MGKRIGRYGCRDDNRASVTVDRSVWDGISDREALSLTGAIYDRCEFTGAARVTIDTLGSLIPAVSVEYEDRQSVRTVQNSVQKLIRKAKVPGSAAGGGGEAERSRPGDTLRARIRKFEAMGWSDAAIDTVLSKQVSTGMTGEQVMESWGPPCKVIETRTSTDFFEDWVYGSSGWRCEGKPILSFRNGIVTGFEE